MLDIKWLVLAFVVCICGGWLINKIQNSPIVNGAEIFFWLFCAYSAISILIAFKHPQGSIPGLDSPYRSLGRIIGNFLGFGVVSGIMALSFRKKIANSGETVVTGQEDVEADSHQRSSNSIDRWKE